MAQEQNFKNHGRIVPAFHIVGFLLLLANFIWALYRLSRGLTGDAIVQLCLAVAVLVMFGSLRGQILTVQDRVIRMEMRLRLGTGPAGRLHPSIATLTPQAARRPALCQRQRACSRWFSRCSRASSRPRKTSRAASRTGRRII